jgi:hypothetical protein
MELPIGPFKLAESCEALVVPVFNWRLEDGSLAMRMTAPLDLAEGDLRRDPSFPHVVLASPVGYTPSQCYPVRHNRWLTLEAEREGLMAYDTVQGSAGGDSEGPREEWDRWQLTHQTVQRNGARIEAINEGDNRFRVTTANVARFTLWLNGDMVDFEKNVQVIVDGETRFSARVQPSVSILLESYQRRGDWGLVYPARVTIELAE